LSFRGASEASEPGIQRDTPHVVLDSGLAPFGAAISAFTRVFDALWE
jgi:hypothetical protein